MKDFVITISREYGSGGHDIGKRLAQRLGIPFYDREIVELTAEKHAIDAVRLSEMEEQSKLPRWFGFGPEPDADDRLFLLQSRTIVELAQQPCVIVGRCADFVLQNHPGRYSFFIYAGFKQRLAHMQQANGRYRKTEDPAREVLKMDRRRAAYYKYHTGQEWGKASNYHLSVDSGTLGLRTVDLLEQFVTLVQLKGAEEEQM